MANFECRVVKVDKVEKHPNADKLTINHIGGYSCISNLKEDGTPRYKEGDLVVYIPENSVLPEWLLKKMGMWKDEKNCGTLSGHHGNRVKAIKLRDVYSEGLLYPVFHEEGIYPDVSDITSKYISVDYIETETGTIAVSLNTNVAEVLGITKYEEPIPTNMSGDVFHGGTEIVESFDVEPLEKYMNVLEDGEMVEMQEKLHGSFSRFIFTKGNTHDEAFGVDKDIYISSKGLGDKGLFFKNNVSNIDTMYVRAFIENNIEEKVKNTILYDNCEMITVMGEVIGCQDLKYGYNNGKIGYRLFDVYVGYPHQGRYLNYEEVKAFAEETGIERVPSLYIGEYSLEKVKEFTDGKTTCGNVDQIREGIVIKPLNERYEPKLGRVMLKSVSQDYKLRKGKTTEYN